MIFEGIYRRFQALRVAKGPIDARFTFTESLAVGQVDAPGWEMTRAGRRFYIAYNGTVPTGIAPVQAFPTTAAQWAVWNPDPAKAYILRALGALLFSGTQGLGGQLLACLFRAPASLGVHATGLAIASGSKISQGNFPGSNAIIKSGVTITDPTLPNWFPVAEDIGAAARVGPLASIINRQLEGRVVIPTGMGLGLAVLAPAGTTPLYLPVAEWEELETDIE